MLTAVTCPVCKKVFEVEEKEAGFSCSFCGFNKFYWEECCVDPKAGDVCLYVSWNQRDADEYKTKKLNIE